MISQYAGPLERALTLIVTQHITGGDAVDNIRIPKVAIAFLLIGLVVDTGRYIGLLLGGFTVGSVVIVVIKS